MCSRTAYDFRAYCERHRPPPVAPFHTDEAVTLHHGDALTVLKGLPEASVDAIVTDPPYSSGGRRENARSIRSAMVRSMEDDEWIAGDAMSTAGFVWLMREIGLEARRVLKPGGHFLAFIDWRMAPNLSAALETADLRQHPILVWDKTKIGMGHIFRNRHEFIVHMSNGNPAPPARRDVPNVIACPPVPTDDRENPCQKPVKLIRTLISVVCPKGGVVLDPFVGSGTTGVAAVLEGRRFIGAELTPTQAVVARDRIVAARVGYRDDGLQGVLGVEGAAL